MSSTESALQFAYCGNSGDCTKAASGETIEWYSGAGEYCPECGEALVLISATPRKAVLKAAGRLPDAEPAARAFPANDAPPVRPPLPTSVPSGPPGPGDVAAPIAPSRYKRSAKTSRPLPRWLWIAGALLVAIVALGYVLRRGVEVGGKPAAALALCAAPSAAQLASDLVRAYAAKTGQPADAFAIREGGSCSVRFGTVAETPEAALARDGIVVVVNPDNPISRVSETQLRGIFNGTIRDWSQIGGRPGPIAAILPSADSDESKALESSLFFGMPVNAGVQRRPTSADVTRAVTGADRGSHTAIGMAVFSQAVTAKVVPISYLPAPNVLSIGSHAYPYTMTIALQSVPGNTTAAGRSFIDFAHSREGTAVVVKDGLVPSQGL